MVRKSISDLSMMSNEKAALEKLKDGIRAIAPSSEIILFGSRAREEGDSHSDVDVLILLDAPVDKALLDRIRDLAYGIELEHDVVFGKIVKNREEWDSRLFKATPLHINVEREGVAL
ncbi:MAG: nucleotidyltransferase domain-containing protein [Spirochaetes bacterium]|nr:nucleotidyltransferase domain-containing protein [Spirochaetota bacterium]